MTRRRALVVAAIAVAVVAVIVARGMLARPVARARPMPEAPPSTLDADGDPLPPFAVARIGSARFRGAGYGLGWTDSGTALVSCGADGVVRVFDAETGAVRREFVAHGGVVEAGGGARSVPDAIGRVLSGRALQTVHDTPFAAAVSRDGRRIVTGGPAALKVWDVATGAQVSTWRASKRSANVLAISDDGRVVAQGGDDGRLEIHASDTGIRVARLRERSEGSGVRSVTSVSLSADGALVAFVDAAKENTIHLVDVATAREIGAAGADAVGGTVAISPRGDVVATSPRAHTVVEGAPDHAIVDDRFVIPLVLRDTATFEERVTTKPFRDGAYSALSFRDDGSLLAAEGASLTIVDAASGAIVRTIACSDPTDSIADIAWSPDGRRLAARLGGKIRVWDARSGTELHPRPPDGDLAGLSSDGGVVAVARSPSVVDLFDTRASRLLRSVGTTERAFGPFVASLAGDVVTTWTFLGDRTSVRIWRTTDGASVAMRMIPLTGGVSWCMPSPVMTRGPSTGPLELLDPLTGLVSITLPVRPIALLRVTPDRRHVVGGSDTVQIWDVATGDSVLSTALPPSSWGSWSVDAFSADSRSMAIVEGNRVHVLDVATGRKIADFVAPESDYARPIALSPDARFAATAGADGAVLLRDVATGDLLATLRGHRGRVGRLEFSGDGRTLASSAETILVWDVARWTR